MSEDISSRFVSQNEIDATKARREEQWKAAYARLGQEPPPSLSNEGDVYDGRSLAEKLAANKAAKQEEWEQKHKLSAQFRSLAPDEIQFLDSVESQRLEEEKQVKEDDEKEVSAFRAAVQARESALSGPPASAAQMKVANTSSATQSKPGATSQTGVTGPNSSQIGTGSSSGTGRSGTGSQSKPAPKPQTKPAPKPKPKAALKGVVVQARKRKSGDDVKAGDNATDKGNVGKLPASTESKDEEDDESPENDRKRRRVE